MNKFFVYGTLKVGGFFAAHFDKVRKTHKSAKLKGFDLYRIGSGRNSWFPGIVEGNGEVIGEIHEYEDADLVLDAMDHIEGYNAADPKNSFYRRKVLEVELEDGFIEKAFVYIFNDELDEAWPQLETGVWPIE